MRALTLAFLALLSLCARDDESRRAGGEPAASPRPEAALRSDPAAADSPRVYGFQRASGESAESFVQGLGPAGSELAHPVIETDAWRLGGKAVIAFYRHMMDVPQPNGPAYAATVATGYAFLPDSGGRYRRVLIGDIEENGGQPEIRSVFFANADGDPGPELVVIAGWRIYTYFTAGTLYGTSIYALPAAGADRFVHLPEVSEKVSGGCECERRGEKRERSPFKTAAEVRAGLRALGYR